MPPNPLFVERLADAGVARDGHGRIAGSGDRGGDLRAAWQRLAARSDDDIVAGGSDTLKVPSAALAARAKTIEGVAAREMVSEV